MIHRRAFLRRSGAAVLWAAAPASALGLTRCAEEEAESGFAEPQRRITDLPARELRLSADVGDVDLGPLGPYRTWLYNGRFPGEEIRVQEGERLRVVLENRLAEPTTVHWHGVPVPSPMDGVPGVTQLPVQPGERFVYEYVAEPAGSFHCHNLYHMEAGMARVFRYVR